MSSANVADCLAAERSFQLEDDVTASVEHVLTCPNCGSEHRLITVVWPGHAEYFQVSCVVCTKHIRHVRCDVGFPLLSATIVAERARKDWRHVFRSFGQLGVVVP